jgi:Calx-beta domain
LEAGPGNAVSTRSLIPISAGRFLFGGEYPMLGVLRRDGKLDPAFRHIWGEGPSDPSVSAVVRLKNARALVACANAGPYLAHTREWPLPETEPSWPAAAVFRALPDGMVDLSFNLPEIDNAILTSGVYDLAVLPEGKFVIATGGLGLLRFQETPSQAVFAFGEKVVIVPESGRFAKFTLYRAGNVRSRGSVMLTTESSAKARRDFQPINRRIQFGAGEWKRTILLPLKNDAVADGTQSITVRLSDPDPKSRVYEVSTVRVDVVDDD